MHFHTISKETPQTPQSRFTIRVSACQSYLYKSRGLRGFMRGLWVNLRGYAGFLWAVARAAIGGDKPRITPHKPRKSGPFCGNIRVVNPSSEWEHTCGGPRESPRLVQNAEQTVWSNKPARMAGTKGLAGEPLPVPSPPRPAYRILRPVASGEWVRGPTPPRAGNEEFQRNSSSK